MNNLLRTGVVSTSVAAAAAGCGSADKMPSDFKNEIMPFEIQYPGMTDALKDAGYKEYDVTKDGSTPRGCRS